MVGRSFYLSWAQVFHVKNSCVHYFPHYLPTVVSTSVSKISLTDCLRKLGKNTIHPPLVSGTLKSTSFMSQFLYDTLVRGRGVSTALGPEGRYVELNEYLHYSGYAQLDKSFDILSW